MAAVITIDQPEIVARIEALARRLTGGDRAEAVAMAVSALERRDARAGSLFGVMAGSVVVADGVDLLAPALLDVPDAEAGAIP